MSNQDQASVHYLPLFRLTEVKDSPGSGRIPVDHHHGGTHIKYWRAPVNPTATRWTEFRGYPLVIDSSGVPWAEACLWLLDRAQAKPQDVNSLRPVAQDLAAYRTFLDELALEWDDFSAVDKYARPTYLYRNHLQSLVNAGAAAGSTSSRRMSTVIRFYRFLMQDPRMRFSPANDPWVEKDVSIAYRDTKGFRQIATVKSTDVSIKVNRRDDAIAETIDDGAKLRPLPVSEQKALVAALKELDNTEYSLMHYTALLTGAREMTVLTLRLRDVIRPLSKIPQWPHKIRCGPGTGIDTKRDVSGVFLSVPKELYVLLHDYVLSEQSKQRRAKSSRGDDPHNYLFLTIRGQPYYESKEDRNAVRDAATPLRRSALSGRPLRKFIEASVIPLVQKKLPHFKYRFHDLRATFGMNWVDYQMKEAGLDAGPKYVWARNELKKLMWHKSAETTDKYLEHRKHLRELQLAQKGWSNHLVDLIREAK